MLHLAVLLEESNVVDRGFDAQDQAEFIVQFDRDRAHLMLDAGTQPAPVEAVTQLALVIAMQFSSQESGNIGRFDSRDQGFQEKRVEGLQSGLAVEDQVGGEFRPPDTGQRAITGLGLDYYNARYYDQLSLEPEYVWSQVQLLSSPLLIQVPFQKEYLLQ
jgi:hypothetical protein